MRNWIKRIILECLQQSLKNQPLVMSYRAPCESDVYEKGTEWKNGNTRYVCESLTAVWKKIPE